MGKEAKLSWLIFRPIGNPHAQAPLHSILGTTLVPIPQLESLPEAGRLMFCLVNWKQITSDQSIWQVTMGYSLELVTEPRIHLRGRPQQDGFRQNSRGGNEVGNPEGHPSTVSVHQSDLLGSQEEWFTNTQAGILRPNDRHNPHDTDLTRGEGAENPKGMPVGSLERQCVGEGIVETDWHDVSAGSPATPSALQRAPAVEDRSTENHTVLRSYGVVE